MNVLLECLLEHIELFDALRHCIAGFCHEHFNLSIHNIKIRDTFIHDIL